MNKQILILILIPFSILSALALFYHGYWGIVEPHFKTFGAGQVLADLVIALSLVLFWIRNDAKKHNRQFWPWVFLTITLGSFGPLLYLLSSKQKPE